MEKNGENPLLLYAYGSYGLYGCLFSSTRLSLLDRGFIYAIAIRGGEEDLGRQWYDDGKLLKKKNLRYRFYRLFIHNSVFTLSRICMQKRRISGRIVDGVIVNQSFNGVIAQVPFVDVMTTMLDDSIPLTTGEYDEWGIQIRRSITTTCDRTHLMITKKTTLICTQDYMIRKCSTGPAKWVAKLRTMKKMILFCILTLIYGCRSRRCIWTI
jgi:oligopeptidase B